MNGPVDAFRERLLPTPGPLTEGFWAAAREHRLVVQRCDACGLLRHYPQPMCASCTSMAWTWTEVSGGGTVYTFTVTHHVFDRRWAERVPYVVATIELDEGVRMVTDLPTSDVERVAIGRRVECCFEDHRLDDGTAFSFPRFRLLDG